VQALKISKIPRLYRLLRILRLFKMVRLLKYNRTLKKINNILKVRPGVGKMISVIITMCFIVHVVTCLWFLMASFSDFNVYTWVGNYNYSDTGIES
jgi:hypothetical protein